MDDDNLGLTNTVAMLEDLGHTAMGASSGSAALEILRRDGSIDLVIIDQITPQMTGFQLAEAIKREWPKHPVILATGFAELPADVHSIASYTGGRRRAAGACSSKTRKGGVVKFTAPSPKT